MDFEYLAPLKLIRPKNVGACQNERKTAPRWTIRKVTSRNYVTVDGIDNAICAEKQEDADQTTEGGDNRMTYSDGM